MIVMCYIYSMEYGFISLCLIMSDDLQILS